VFLWPKLPKLFGINKENIPKRLFINKYFSIYSYYNETCFLNANGIPYLFEAHSPFKNTRTATFVFNVDHNRIGIVASRESYSEKKYVQERYEAAIKSANDEVDAACVNTPIKKMIEACTAKSLHLLKAFPFTVAGETVYLHGVREVRQRETFHFNINSTRKRYFYKKTTTRSPLNLSNWEKDTNHQCLFATEETSLAILKRLAKEEPDLFIEYNNEKHPSRKKPEYEFPSVTAFFQEQKTSYEKVFERGVCFIKPKDIVEDTATIYCLLKNEDKHEIAEYVIRCELLSYFGYSFQVIKARKAIVDYISKEEHVKANVDLIDDKIATIKQEAFQRLIDYKRPINNIGYSLERIMLALPDKYVPADLKVLVKTNNKGITKEILRFDALVSRIFGMREHEEYVKGLLERVFIKYPLLKSIDCQASTATIIEYCEALDERRERKERERREQETREAGIQGDERHDCVESRVVVCYDPQLRHEIQASAALDHV